MKRRTCSYCKACLMNYDSPTNSFNGKYQIGCKLGYKLEEGPCYIHNGSGRDSFINNLYPVENCSKPKTIKQFINQLNKQNENNKN